MRRYMIHKVAPKTILIYNLNSELVNSDFGFSLMVLTYNNVKLIPDRNWNMIDM